MKNQVKIGDVILANNVITAPMAGITDRPFREELHKMGPGLVFTEMISDKALTYKNCNTLALLDIKGEEVPVAVQLCGSEPQVMSRAAQIAEEMGAAIIDINMGCPAPKIIKNGEGAALMLDEEMATEIVKQVIRAVRIPVTVKMRAGFSQANINATSLAQKVEAAGAAAITVHGRTRDQFYHGLADWQVVQKVAAKVSVPVFGNGDIYEAQDALGKLQMAGCAGVMLGRGIQGNPWLVQQIAAVMQKNPEPAKPSISEIMLTIKRQLGREVELDGEERGIRKMRKHIAWYIKGYRNAALMRNKINQAQNLPELLAMLTAYEQELQQVN